MKKYIIRNFLRRVKFDYFFRFLNLTLHSKIFFKRSHFLKFGKIVHFNNLNFLVKPFVLNRFSLLFFRSNFIVQGRNYNFILKDLNNSDANFLFSDYGFFSHNNIKKLFSIKGSHFFFFNCLYRYETILKKLDDFAISQYLCETLSGRIFKLLERKFIFIAVRFFDKFFSLQYLKDLLTTLSVRDSFFFIFNTNFLFLILYGFVYFFFFFFIYLFKIIFFNIFFFVDYFSVKIKETNKIL